MLSPQIPGLQVLRAECERVKELVTKRQAEVKQERRAAWAAWTRVQHRTNPRDVFDLIREDKDRSMAVLQQPDGSLTGDFRVMDKQLRAFWEPIFQLYKNSPEPCWEAFLARYGAHMPPTVPMEHVALTPDMLRVC